jgi:hypothetical protein
MYFLIYRSVASETPTEADLHRLLEHARAANAAREVTGMLLYQNGRYMQMLEGEEEVVRSLFASIAADGRHRMVKVLASGPLTKRHFSDWSMGFRNMDQFGNLPDYDTYLATQLADDRFSSEERVAHQFMFHFIESA